MPGGTRQSTAPPGITVPLRDDDVLFLSGSHAEGWANPGSDFDYYVVTDCHGEAVARGGLEFPHGGRRVQTTYRIHEGRRTEVQVWLKGDVLAFGRSLIEHPLDPTVELSGPMVLFAHRLHVGEALKNPDGLAELRAAVDRRKLAEYLWRFNARVHESYVTDARFARGGPREWDAVLSSRLALEHAIDAYLATRGETNPQPKWRLRRIERAEGEGSRLRDDFLEALEPLETPDPLGGEGAAPRARIDRRLALAGSLAACWELGWVYEDLVQGVERTAPGPRRQPGVRLQRLRGNDLRLVRPEGGAHPVNPAGALVWALLDGRHGLEAIERTLVRRLDLTRARAGDTTRSFVRGLSAKGLLAERT